LPAGTFRAFTAIFLICLFYLSTAGVFAQEGEGSVEDPENQTADAITQAERAYTFEDDPATVPGNPASVWNVFRVLLTLAVVAAAIYGMVFFIKKAAKGGAAKDPFLKNLASTQLGVNRSAYVISVGSQAWLVGAAENGVNLIAEIGDKDILDAMLLENSRKDAEAPGRIRDFKSLLRRLGMPVESKPPSPENIRNHSERLKGL